MPEETVLIPAIISNIAALILLWLSWKKKNIARLLFALLFLWAAVTNWITANYHPTDYLNYTQYAIPVYKKVITDVFSKHITGYVSFIAVCQFMIGLGFLARDIIVKIACIGAIVFFIAIAPLGWGSAFPFSITASIAAFLLYKHQFAKNIFQNKWWV